MTHRRTKRKDISVLAAFAFVLLAAPAGQAVPDEGASFTIQKPALDSEVVAFCALGPSHADDCSSEGREGASGYGFIGNGFMGQVAMQLRWGPGWEERYAFGCYGNLVGGVAVHGGCYATGDPPPDGVAVEMGCYTSADSYGTVECVLFR